MTATALIRSLGLDRYDRVARLQPALLVLLPLFLLVAVWWPGARTGSGWLVSLLVACGAVQLLAQATRRRGRALEKAWGDRIGRRHSARLLSFGDATLGAAQKRRIAAWVDLHGPGLPSAADEADDPQAAVDRRLAAIGWLLEATRGDAASSMLLAENVAYGFWRNMRGLRTIGIVLASMVMIADVYLCLRVGVGDPRFLPAATVGAAAAAAVAAWTGLVTRRAVEDASLVYAERLFAQIDNPAVTERLRPGPTAKTRGKARTARPKGRADGDDEMQD